jgi:hypothetical protein
VTTEEKREIKRGLVDEDAVGVKKRAVKNISGVGIMVWTLLLHGC